MGGIIIKHKIILITRRRLIIYAAIILIIVLGLLLTLRFAGKMEEQTSSGYTYLEYKDGVYIGNENTDKGNIKAELTIKKGKIKDIRVLEFPQEYIKENTELETELTKVVGKIIKTQEIISLEEMERSSYIINKLLKAIRNALDQSLLQ